MIVLFIFEVVILVIARFYLVSVISMNSKWLERTSKQPSPIGNFYGFMGPLGALIEEENLGLNVKIPYWIVILMLVAMPITIVVAAVAR